MRTHPATITTLLTAAALAAACNAAGPSTTLPQDDRAGPRGQPPVVHSAGLELATPIPDAVPDPAGATRSAPRDPADHAPSADPTRVGDPVGLDDPAAAAAGLLIDLLADEGLLVTSIDTYLERVEDDRAQVQVDIAHSPGHGHPVQSRYLLDLAWDADRWRLVSYSEPG